MYLKNLIIGFWIVTQLVSYSLFYWKVLITYLCGRSTLEFKISSEPKSNDLICSSKVIISSRHLNPTTSKLFLGLSFYHLSYLLFICQLSFFFGISHTFYNNNFQVNFFGLRRTHIHGLLFLIFLALNRFSM